MAKGSKTAHGKYRWEVAPSFEGAEQLARRLGTAPLVAQMLHNRGLGDAEKAGAFLNPKLNDLHDPELLEGAVEAADEIIAAVEAGQKIVLYGDYDVDGITGVAILHAALRMLGANVDFYVPHRLQEGYGVNARALDRIIAGGAGMIITVDCGISDAETLARAHKVGARVIVTDHHAPPETLPDTTVVHPSLPGGNYPNPDLCGAGVAFKLAWQVARKAAGSKRVDPQMRDLLLGGTCLAALGTIADVVPLVGENRVLAVYGLKGLPAANNPGLAALLSAAGLVENGRGEVNGYHVGFILAPRLNACGRMGHAAEAVRLLTDAEISAEHAEKIAERLTRKNNKRRRVEQQITDEAVQMVRDKKMDRPSCKAIVLAGQNWHGGVIGIVASRLVDRFNKPAVLIAAESKTAQGSARSIPGFHMRDALAACGEHLISFGGHAMAGGLKIQRDKIDTFAEAFARYAGRNINEDQLTPTLSVDAEAAVTSLGYNVVSHLERMAPFGQGNPKPMVLLRGCRVLGGPRRVGARAKTLTLTLAQNEANIRAVGFGMGALAERLVGVNEIDVVAQPVLNTFNGRTTVELKLADISW